MSHRSREALMAWERGLAPPQKLFHRPGIVLAAAECLNNRAVAERRLARSLQTICLWRRRYPEHDTAGVQCQPESGCPRETGQDKTAESVATTTGPRAGTYIIVNCTTPHSSLSPGQRELTGGGFQSHLKPSPLTGEGLYRDYAVNFKSNNRGENASQKV